MPLPNVFVTFYVAVGDAKATFSNRVLRMERRDSASQKIPSSPWLIGELDQDFWEICKKTSLVKELAEEKHHEIAIFTQLLKAAFVSVLRKKIDKLSHIELNWIGFQYKSVQAKYLKALLG